MPHSENVNMHWMNGAFIFKTQVTTYKEQHIAENLSI